jgi:SAM-dependent methyltransferase
MLGMLQKIVSRLPESGRLRLRRLRRPRVAYFLRAQDQPISDSFGYDRGTPVDRHHVEQFLSENSRYIRGVCLEVTDSGYTRRFGGGVERADVLDINRNNPKANVFGDLRRLEAVPDESYDCFILTQVLHYIDDVHAAAREAARVLRPGGSLLVTLPAVHAMEERFPHFWKFSTASARYLFGRHFPEEHLEVRGWGNVVTGIAIWVGLAQQDLPRRLLNRHDPRFATTITVRATKPARAAAADGDGVSGVSAELAANR